MRLFIFAGLASALAAALQLYWIALGCAILSTLGLIAGAAVEPSRTAARGRPGDNASD